MLRWILRCTVCTARRSPARRAAQAHTTTAAKLAQEAAPPRTRDSRTPDL